jgi:hypothetical protein
MNTMFVWTISDAFAVVIAAIFIAIASCFYAVQWWKQSRCKHDNCVSETQACDAICNDCGKNLGFIQVWRNKKAAAK